MPGQFALTKNQVADFSRIQGLERKDLERVLKRLKSTKLPPLSQAALRHLINDALPPEKRTGSSEVVESLGRVILGLGGLELRGFGDLHGLLDDLDSDLREVWADDQSKFERWNRIRPLLAQILSIDAVRMTIKALDVSYEYANLLQYSRIMTDVRPIFNEGGGQIEGAVVSFTLRMSFLNAGQPKSLSIEVDAADLKILVEQCQRALRKAETAKRRFSSADIGIPLTIAGSDEHNEN